MRISRRIVLAVILCMVVCLAACSKIAPETSKDYDNESSIPTQENQQRPLDIPQLETDNSETKNEENQMEIGEPKVEEKQNQPEYSNAITLRMNDKEYSLEAEDAEKVKRILDLDNMEKAGADETSESFCAYEFVNENNYYGITQDLMKIEAVGKGESDDEYSNYTKQTTEEEREILGNVISKYECRRRPVLS